MASASAATSAWMARALGLRATARARSTANGLAARHQSRVSSFRHFIGAVPSSASRTLGAPADPAPSAPARRGVFASAAKGSKEVSLKPEATVSVRLVEADVGSWEGDILALGLFEDSIEKDESGSLKNSELKELDAALGGIVTELLDDKDFKAAKGTSSFVRLGGKARFFGLVGLGAADKAASVGEWGPSTWEIAGNAVAAAAKGEPFAFCPVAHPVQTGGDDRQHINLFPEAPVTVSLECALAQANKARKAGFAVLGQPALEAAVASKVSLGAQLGAYESTRFKNKPKPSPLASLEILSSANGTLDEAAAIARGVTLTRYLVESPPNVATPSYLAEAAAMIADEFPEVMSLEVLEREDCEKLGMGCYLGVAEASEQPPKFIHLTYKPAGGEAKRKIAVVGKGLTFDSGGYNLKAGPGSMIEMMKFDMGGSGATLGAALATAGLAPAGVEVHFIVASCENMIDGKGLRPGDVITASNGKTVEVNNTDAEGRLTLADALLFAQNQCGVQAVVDIATLTGACMVALGPGIAGYMTPNDAMAERVVAASKAAGEKIWRLPLEADYMEQMKSPIADMVNTGGRMGGAITAGLFLKEFINEGTEWTHIDMAGPVWDDKKGGATGWGAATLAAWIQEESKIAGK